MRQVSWLWLVVRSDAVYHAVNKMILYVFILLLRTTGQWLHSSYCHYSTLLLVSWVFVSVLWYHSGAECHFHQKQV